MHPTLRLRGGEGGLLKKTAKLLSAPLWFFDAVDKEAVRRGSTLFALPIHSADGAKAVWGTADAIWTALGDSSTDGRGNEGSAAPR